MTAHTSLWTDLRRLHFCQRWVDAGGLPTRVLEAGPRDAPALILIHGTGGHAEAYMRNLAAHAEHFHTYAIDMIGHGWSAKPLDCGYEFADYVSHLLAFLDAEGIERAHISGESMGGGITGWFAHTHPDRVDRIVLNTGVAPLYEEHVVERISRLTLEAVRNPTWESVRTRLEFLMHDPADVSDDLIDTRLAIYRQPELPEVTPLLLRRLADPETRVRNHLTEEHWRAITHPALVLWTSDDPTAPPAVGERVAGWLPNGRFALMKDCGHWPQWEDPETFNRIHLAFLRDVD